MALEKRVDGVYAAPRRFAPRALPSPRDHVQNTRPPVAHVEVVLRRDLRRGELADLVEEGDGRGRWDPVAADRAGGHGDENGADGRHLRRAEEVFVALERCSSFAPRAP